MNTDQAKARMYDLERHMRALAPVIIGAARRVREAALAHASVTAPDFEALNAGLLLDQVALIAAEGVRARDELKALSAERERLKAYLETLGDGA
ncbi:MAG TPA: hypothetical protein VNN55_08980 [bacterium]|nr:hypothetical protein [bacterium]